MWTTLALMSALSWTPAQAGQLQLKNARFTYGILGQERKDNIYLPGDMAVLAFDIEGLKEADDGSAQYSMSLTLKDHKKNKVVFETKVPQEIRVVNTLGGSRLPSFALANIGTDTEPGRFTMTVTVNDVRAKTNATVERDFEVKKLEFGIVVPGFVYIRLNEEEAGAPPQLAPPVAVPGQNLMLHFSVVGFVEAGDKNQPKVRVSVEIKDEAGASVLKRPITGLAEKYEDENAQKLKFIPFSVPIQVNRSGKFKILVSAKDEHSGKTTSLPPLNLKVVEVNDR
jgi:hypothetical protein